jgi:hypothetical protein
LEIEAAAKRRLADEYDAAQERGEIRRHGGDQTSGTEDCLPCAADIGLTHKDIFEARQVRDAENTGRRFAGSQLRPYVRNCEIRDGSDSVR